MSTEYFRILSNGSVAGFARTDSDAAAQRWTERHWFLGPFAPPAGHRHTQRYEKLTAQAFATEKGDASLAWHCLTEWQPDYPGDDRQLYEGDWHIIDTRGAPTSVRSVPVFDRKGTLERSFSADTATPPLVRDGVEIQYVGRRYADDTAAFEAKARAELGLSSGEGRTWYAVAVWTRQR